MDGPEVERRFSHVIFDDAGTRVSVVQRLRIDRQVTSSGGYAVAQLQPTLVRIEQAGKEAVVVNLDQPA